MQLVDKYRTSALSALVLLLVSSTGAMADITFNGSGALSNTFQQTLNNPCVIGDKSCKEPAGLGYEAESGTPGGGNGSSYDLFSPVYQAVSPHPTYSGNLIPTSFTIGVDENIAAGQSNEFLLFFKTYLCGGGSTVGPTTQVSGQTALPANCVAGAVDATNSYIPATPTAIPNNNNGNGFSDFTLNGFS